MKRLKKYFAVFISMCMILRLIAAGPITVSAAVPSTYTVSTYSDLTAAINNAQAGDTIALASDITVTAQISIIKSIIIDGNGHTLSVPVPGLDDAGKLAASPSSFRVFNCSASGRTIEIKNVKIKGGMASGGSAILNNSGTILKLTDVNISNSGGISMAGGGIYNSGTAYFLSCNISRNGGSYGGGFLNFGTMFIENTTFSENRSLSSSGGGGAGENQGTLYVNNSTFANNISTELGSAINNYNGTMYVLNSSFIGNAASSSAYSSGAVRSNNVAKFVNCIFAHNYYTQDGGNNYVLSDFCSGYTSGIELYNCVYHQSTLPVGNVSTAFNCTHYTGLQDGTNNFLAAGGSTTKLVDANGMQMGTGTIFQPFLVKQTSDTPPAVFLKSGSVAYDKAADSAFLNGAAPIAAYKTNSSWVYLVGSSNADSNVVTYDQVGQVRGTVGSGTNAVGSTTVQANNLVMLRILAASGGSVFGGSIYGDIYPNGTQVTVTAYPDAGKKFTGWKVNGEASPSVLSNPYTITLLANTDLQPTYTVDTGYTVTYNGNGNTAGIVPAPTSSGGVISTVTLASNSGNLEKAGYSFAGWNTNANGTGTTYNEGASYNFGANTVLYAKWIKTASAISINYYTNINPTSAVISLNDAEGTAMTNQDFDIYIDETKINTVPYNTGSGASYTYTLPGNLAAGNHVLKAAAVVGGAENSKQFAIKPHVTATYGGVTYPSNTLTNQNVVFTSTDTNLEYSTNGIDFTAFTSGMSVTNSAEYTFRFVGALDSGTYVIIDTNIDQALPEITGVTGNPSAWTANDVTLTVNASDMGAGLNTGGAYSFDNGTTWTTSNSKVFSSNQNVGIQVKDQAGNIYIADIVTIDKIDKVLPTLNVSTDYNYSAAVPTENDVVFTLSNPNAVISGVTYYYSTDDGTSWNKIDGNSFTVLNTDNTTVNYKFKAVSGSALESAPTASMPVYIVKPSFDAENNSIVVTAETSDNDVYSGDWTNKAVTFSLTGGVNSEAFLKYQYSTDGTSWTDLNGSTLTVSEEADKTYYFRVETKGLSTGAETTGSAVKIDKTAPTNAAIKIGTNEFKSFLNTITFGIFFNNTVNINITADSNISGVSKIEYQKVSSPQEYNENGPWTTGSSFSVDPDEKFAVYAKITDNAGNYVVINSDGVVVDKTRPVITGADDGASYYIGRVINLSDALSGVDNAAYKIGSTDEVQFASGDLLSNAGEYTIMVKDKSGNTETAAFEIKALPEVKDIVYTKDCEELIKDIRAEFDNHKDLAEPYKTETDNKIKALEARYSELDKEVEDKITETNDLKEVVDSLPGGNDGLIGKEETIKDLLALIDDMTNEQKYALKDQIDILDTMLDNIAVLKEQVESVKEQINSLPSANEVTKENAAKINIISDSCNKLTNEQIYFVGTSLLEKLKNDQEALRRLMLHDAATDTTITGIDGTTFDSRVYLVVTPLDNNTENTAILDAAKNFVKEAAKSLDEIKGKELTALYDVSLFKDNVKIQPDGKVKVSIKIPDNLINKKGLDVVHITDDGTVTSMHASVEGEYLTFITTHFSEYGIVSIPEEAAVLPKTGGPVDFTTLMLMGSLIFCAGEVLFRRKKEL